MSDPSLAVRSTADKSALLRSLALDRESVAAPQPRRGFHRWPVIMAAAFVTAVLFGVYVLWRSEKPVPPAAGSASPAAPAVETNAATVPPAGGAVLEATGYVTARRIATVSAKVTGKVMAVYIEEGMAVEEGQVLARLDPTDAEAALSLALAEQHAAVARLAELEARLAFAEREKVRQSELQKRDLASAAVLDSAATEVATLKAQLGSARAAVEVAARAAAVSRTQLDNTVIRAPFSGIVIAKAAQPGEMISPVSAGGGFTRTGIGTIVDMDSLEVEVEVNEAYIQRVEPEQPVKIVLNAYPDEPLPGRVLAIIPAADRSKATVRVRVAFAARDPRAVPDMGVRVSFLENGAP